MHQFRVTTAGYSAPSVVDKILDAGGHIDIIVPYSHIDLTGEVFMLIIYTAEDEISMSGIR